MREWMGGMDFVGRDEFEAVKAMAAAARDENEALKPAIAALEGNGGNREAQGRAEAQAGSGSLTDEPESDERDDGAPIEVLEQYFEARGWACERTGEGEIVASANGSWAQYELRGVWRSEDQVLQFLAFPDIKVAAEKRSAIYEALGLINEQLWLGHFELWSGSGLIVFRHAAMVGETDNLSLRAGGVDRRGGARGMRALLSGLPVRAVGRQVARRGDFRGADRNRRGSLTP